MDRPQTLCTIKVEKEWTDAADPYAELGKLVQCSLSSTIILSKLMGLVIISICFEIHIAYTYIFMYIKLHIHTYIYLKRPKQ